ncbi:MAG: phenylalanine--tRNA ligase subunit alpha [Caldilineaceae bacterium SB0665_bin_21]|nr:phenylalanine--tRNA ligase subunit alpha [Caldilineaceae bacterium SB0665_bin_21]MYC64548.1 phenylalanine--tRNA ligase subunit alpha [Caldilineaceae bacterium SB0661_bin_34]
MSTLLEQLSALRTEAAEDIRQAQDEEALASVFSAVLGRQGRLTQILRGLGSLPREERPEAGRAGNECKRFLEDLHAERRGELADLAISEELSAEGIDVTLPGRQWTLGKLHPSTVALREIYTIFRGLGFSIYEGREVESDEYNFELLNMPPGHPARDMWDTFYTTEPGIILRTHTSPGQIHAMREYAPNPIRIILPGKVYRHEDVTARAESQFYQVEGLVVGRTISLSDLKGTVQHFADRIYGSGRKVRFRKSYFPFTEPSVEVDVDCMLCRAQGCRICKYTGWLEIMGAGMVHPKVLANGGYDPAEWSGFAFGMGPERVAMLKYAITDIRLFYTNDARFLEQMV